MRARTTICAVAVAMAVTIAQIGCRQDPDMTLTVGCIHLEPSANRLDIDSYDTNNNFGREVHEQVRRMGLKYKVQGFAGESHYSRGIENDAAVHVLLLVPEMVKRSAELPVPQEGDVIYLLRSDVWEAHPAPVTGPTRHSIRIIPDQRRNGVFTVKITGFDGWPDSMTLKPDGVQ